MKGLVVPVLGTPVVVNGVWDSIGAVTDVLDCEAFDVLNLPNTADPVLSLYFDDSGKNRGRDVNPVLTELVADVLQPGDYIAGPGLIAGFNPATGASVDLGLLQLIQIGARLVRAERGALR